MLDSQIQQENQYSNSLNDADNIVADGSDMLVSRAVSGDKQAFNQLMSQYYSDIYRFSFNLTRNKTDAEDLTHDVALKIAKSIQQFQFNCAFLSWVYRIVVNTQKDNYKKQLNRLQRDGNYLEQQQLQQCSPQPDETVEFNELLNSIDLLPQKLKITLILVMPNTCLIVMWLMCCSVQSIRFPGAFMKPKSN